VKVGLNGFESVLPGSSVWRVLTVNPNVEVIEYRVSYWDLNNTSFCLFWVELAQEFFYHGNSLVMELKLWGKKKILNTSSNFFGKQVIIVVIQVGAAKTCVAVVEALEKGRTRKVGGENMCSSSGCSGKRKDKKTCVAAVEAQE
jgi:hypothetical protein